MAAEVPWVRLTSFGMRQPLSSVRAEFDSICQEFSTHKINHPMLFPDGEDLLPVFDIGVDLPGDGMNLTLRVVEDIDAVAR